MVLCLTGDIARNRWLSIMRGGMKGQVPPPFPLACFWTLTATIVTHQPYRAPNGRSCSGDLAAEDGVGSHCHEGGDWNVFYMFLHGVVDFSQVSETTYIYMHTTPIQNESR